jgi:hypothetical protein
MFELKKSVIAALTGALVVGATATTFAAANPFSDVPVGHWAYNSVTKLAQEGVIEGYGDGTFLGNRNITRYEMAQMVAKALAKNPTGASKAELDKLAAEFREELDNLGVRVTELEKHSDMVQWTGKIEYTYNHHKAHDRTESARLKATTHSGVFRLEPRAEINDHWAAVARLDLGYDGREDSTGYAKLKRVYAEGNYEKFGVKLGRFGFCPDYEDGLAIDTVLSGINLNFGSKWKVDVDAGRIGATSDEAHFGPGGAAGNHYYEDLNNLGELIYGEGKPTDVVRIGVQYKDNGEQGLYGGVAYTWAKDQDFAIISKNGEGDKAQVLSGALGYRFNDMAKVWGGIAHNSKASENKTSWQVEARYGKYGDYAEKGDWAIWAGYSKFSESTAIATDQGDDIATGEKGWHVGAAYAPFKNVGLLVRYADGKIINTNIKDRHFWARAEFFF